MKPLSMKLEDALREDFDALCASEGKTQVAMFEALIASYKSKPVNAPEIEALQRKIAELEADLSIRDAALDKSEEVFKECEYHVQKLDSELQERNATIESLQAKNSELAGKLESKSDLSADVKELGRIDTLENAIYNYGKARVRARLGNPDLLTKEKAVEAFVKSNKE